MNEQHNPTKMMEQFADIMKGAVPTVKTNANGYEIRTKVLEVANQTVWQDYYAKWGQFEVSARKEHNEVVTKVDMPTVPGTDKVLEAAQKFYDFVNNAAK